MLTTGYEHEGRKKKSNHRDHKVEKIGNRSLAAPFDRLRAIGT